MNELFNRARARGAVVKMNCDGAGSIICPHVVKWGVRVHTPSITQIPGHDQVRLTLKLHACDMHKDQGCFKLDRLLTMKLKTEIEQFAKAKRPIDWKPDFDAAFIQYVDIFEPQYQQFLALTEENHIAAAEQLFGAPISRHA
jgi:hypothetical protein